MWPAGCGNGAAQVGLHQAVSDLKHWPPSVRLGLSSAAAEEASSVAFSNTMKWLWIILMLGTPDLLKGQVAQVTWAVEEFCRSDSVRDFDGDFSMRGGYFTWNTES